MPDAVSDMSSHSPHTISENDPDSAAMSRNPSQDDSLSTPRPTLGSRLSSGTMIIPRESSEIATEKIVYPPDDVRCMSPRRSMEDVEKLSQGARSNLQERAKSLQANLSEIVDRIESVKEEHGKLEGGNKFLQSYVSFTVMYCGRY